MIREMEGPSSSDQNNQNGSVVKLGARKTLLPVRVKTLLEMYKSDDEDSEDKESRISSDSESDASLQPLPDDDEPPKLRNPNEESENPQDFSSLEHNRNSVSNESSKKKPTLPCGSSSPQSKRIFDPLPPLEPVPFVPTSSNSELQVPRQIRRNYSDLSTSPVSDVSISQSIIPTSCHSNITSISKQPETSMYPPAVPKFDGHFHPSLSSQSESSVHPVPPASHLITDTPLKNNPPLGSMRPTPSLSHRSIFQTPQSSKLQDYSKNQGQTPATLFGKWSQKHMPQTPLQNRSASETLMRPLQSSIFDQQHQSARHEHPSWHKDTEKKRVRRPLEETVPPEPNKETQEERPTNLLKDEPSSPPVKNHFRGHRTNDGSSRIQARYSNVPIAYHELKENLHPTPTEQSAKEIIRNSDKINETNAGVIVDAPDPPKGFMLDYAMAKQKNKNIPERRPNVQASVPMALNIKPPNQGETITVNGKKYLVLGSLGEGMCGHVLRVQDLASSELKAVKFVNLNRLDKEAAQGCMQEISMLHRLQAPCVVKMFDYEIQFPSIHVVMEMGDTDFRSLLQSMSDTKPLPLTMILYYWTEMLTAVKHIHDNNVIHSDLKPANFLLVRGRLKLIDFGVASNINADMTSVVKHNALGTLNYISPEALMDVGGNAGDSPNKNLKYKISYKSDVWSLGCILYSLVYGYTPFHNIRAQWARMNAITNPNQKISFELPPGSDAEPPPPVLVDVMRKCLQHNPKARPSVEQLLKIPYIPNNTPQVIKPAANIPAHVLVKIKRALDEEEWRKFTEIMEAIRNN